jgi:GntR family transcriptional regulator
MQFNNNGQAIYLQIVDYICEKILLNEYKTEDKIPSVRELGIQLEVNPNTVARAYDLLKQQQLIYDKRGIGYFIADEAKTIAQQYRKQEFTEKELPILFRTLHMLGMEPAELTPSFAAFKNKYSAA